MDKIFCIYEGKEIAKEDSNAEHIIPLSLGGNNMFTIPVSKTKNSELGTTVDGELSKDPLISLQRMETSYKGHSRKSVHPVFKRAFIKKSKKPVQVRYTPGKLKIFSPIDKRDLGDEELIGETVRTTIPYNKMIRMVFAAKVALSAGYYIYDDVFVKYADHASLRKLMNYRKGDSFDSLIHLPLSVECNLSTDEGLDEKKLICEILETSSVQFRLYADNRIRTTVAIGGKFLGSVTYNADVEKFPQSGEYEGGHIIKVLPDGLLIMSYKEMLDIIADAQSSK